MNSTASAIKNYVWPAGVMLLVFQASTALIPISERRDWFQFYAVLLLAALYFIYSTHHYFISTPQRRASLRLEKVYNFSKTALVFYAIGILFFHIYSNLHILHIISILLLAYVVLYKHNAHQRGVNSDNTGNDSLLGWSEYALIAIFIYFYSGIFINYLTVFRNATLSAALLFYGLTFIKLLIAIFLTLAAFYPNTQSAPLSSTALKRLHAVAHVSALALLTLIAFDISPSLRATLIHHWRAILEPAFSVQEGGWLLWDVPAQYGFLLTALIAFFPADNVWQSLYFVNASLLALTGYMIFRVIFLYLPSFWGFFLSLLISICATELIGYQTGFGGYMTCPSAGALRFIWVYLILGYIFYCAENRASSIRIQTRSIIGDCIWLCSVLWSAESAVYVTVIWLPYKTMFFTSQYIQSGRPLTITTVLLSASKAISKSALYLGVILALISCLYLFKLGELPDFRLHYIYAFAYKESYGTMPISESNNAYTLPLTLFYMAVLVLCAYARDNAPTPKALVDLSAIAACALSVWAVSSYYMARSHDNNIINLLPIMIYASTIITVITKKLNIPLLLRVLNRLSIICLYCTVIAAPLIIVRPTLPDRDGASQANNLTEKHAADELFFPENFLSLLPDIRNELTKLLHSANFKPKSQLLVLAYDRFNPESDSRWLEYAYFHEFDIKPWVLPNIVTAFGQSNYPDPSRAAAPLLSPDIFQLIAERRAVRLCDEGWVLEPKKTPLDTYPWIKQAILKYYREVNVYESEVLRLRKFTRIDKAGCTLDAPQF